VDGHQVTFEVATTMIDQSTIGDLATTVVLRSTSGAGAQVPSVAGIGDEVTLTLALVAVAA
jgi:hypothetical protein